MTSFPIPSPGMRPVLYAISGCQLMFVIEYIPMRSVLLAAMTTVVVFEPVTVQLS